MSRAGQIERNAHDLYKTPHDAFASLLPFLSRVHTWEPAQGDGRLVRWMNEAKIECVGSDIQDKPSVDFLNAGAVRFGAKQIVTNPPYLLARQFVEKALSFVPEVWMLTRINFLGSAKRKAFWEKHRLSALFTLSDRPSFCAAVKCSKCKRKWSQDIEAPRPKKCGEKIYPPGVSPRFAICDGALKYTTSDACEYGWLYWGERWKGFHWL